MMKITIALPREIYILRPAERQNIRIDNEQFHIYFKNIILPLKNEWDVVIDCEYGCNHGDFWRIEAFPYNKNSFPLVLKLYDEFGEKIAEKGTTIRLVDKNKWQDFCVLPIGDSMTHSHIYIDHLVNKLKNIKTKGIRTFDGTVFTEGRGGWSYNEYFNSVTFTTGGASPFLFPKGVAGKEYYGDLDFENEKKNPERHTYVCDGLPIFDLEDGMVYHKNGKLYKRENGDDIKISDTTEWEFSFSKYIERFNIGRIDAVSILMGANDLQLVPYEESERIIRDYIENTKEMISEIFKYSSEIKVIINLPIVGTEQYSWGIKMGCSGTAKQYNHNIIKAASRLIDEFSDMKHVYISSMLLNIDANNGFDKAYYKTNIYTDNHEHHHTDWVHPNKNGYCQMGDALAAVIEAIRW